MNRHCIRLLLFCALLSRISAQSGCPPLEAILPCRCLMRGEEYQIWCSHSDLPRVLDGLRAVGQYITQPIDELILENNYLPSLPGRTFIPLQVMRLMLRYNGLERVSPDWLTGLSSSLMELFIVEPDLRSLPDDSLLQLNSLEAITIQTNLMKRLPLVAGLPKLRYVQIESLALLELSPRNLKGNPMLQKLHISMSPRLERLEAHTLRDLPSLSLVNMSYCGLTWIHPRAFMNLPLIKEISLVGNKITDAGMVGRGSRDLPELEIIRLDYNYIDKIDEAAFVDLPALKKLYLSNNRITELNHGAFHRVPLLRSLDLNRNNLRRVHPESFLQHSGSGLEELWLVENDISHVAELRSLLDALPRLTFLDMSYNNLEAIPFGSLRGHATLEYLHLDYNKLHMIDREAFMAMPALRELRLKNNSLTDIVDAPLWNLPALKGLDLSGNFFRRLEPDLLLNLPALRRFDISGNEITYIDPAFFIQTPEIEHINISYNAMAALHPATFRHLLGLYELDVSHNGLLEFVPGLPRGIEYLYMSHNEITGLPIQPSPDLDLPVLRLLDLSANRIQKIPKGALTSLPQLRRLYLSKNFIQQIGENSLEGLNRLESLDLQNNHIIEIHPNAFKQIIELRELNLRNNRLDLLIPELFKNAPRLKVLDISKNQIAEILPGTFDQNRELQAIDASDNVLVQLSNTFFGLKNLRVLDLTNNRLKHIDPQILSSLTSLRELRASKNYIQELKQGAFNNLQHLKTLKLDNNELETIEPNAIRGLPLLKTLKLSHNKLKEIPNNAFMNLPLLQIAELQENQLRHLAPSVFNSVPHLLMLNLSHNQLGSVEDAGLRTLRSLEMLDLSNNRISRVAGANLEKMEWLVELRMDDNSICGVQGSFNGMPRLRVLSLRNNKMMSFPEEAVQRLRGNIAVLDIEGNPLVCSCSLLWLQAWLQESSTTGPRCVDGTFVREMRLSRQACTEEERSMDIVAPGCEAELLSVPGMLGTSQVFSPWGKLKTNDTRKHIKNNLPPSPEESEYFYDEYVDYPYNATSVIEQHNGLGNGNVKQQLVETITNVPKAPSTSSPHYTPGDTPTIYAASKNKSRPDIPKEVVNSPSTSGFTFFGVPLPSFNFNNILKGGNGRMEGNKSPIVPQIAQRKVAIVNKPGLGSNGRIGMQSPPPAPMPSSAMKPPPEMPNQPEIQTGGFKPILPGSGGFTPIVNPELMMQKPINVTREVVKPVIETQIKENLQALSKRKGEIVEELSTTTTPTTSRSHQQAKIEVVSESKVNTENIELLEQANVEELPKSTTFKPELETVESEKFPEEITTEQVTTTQFSSVTLPTPKQTTIGVTESFEVEKFETTEAPPMAALLAPGGQQPQFRPPGRSTITKVTSPHMTASAPLQSNLEIAHISEPLKNNREGKTTFSEEIEGIQNDTNWYFANYNRTIVDPHVGASENLNKFNAGSKLELKGLFSFLSILIYYVV